jgi:hypothetical protein
VIVRFERVGGREPPPDRERLQVEDDGSFTLWRSNWSPVVGRFGGRLADSELEGLREDITAAAATGSSSLTPYPDAAIDIVEAGGASAMAGQHQVIEGPWGDLFARLRRLLGALTDQPVAAIAVERNGLAARLVHRGGETLDLDLQGLWVRVVQWDKEYTKVGDWSARHPGKALAAGPGWALDLPSDHGLTEREDAVLHTYVGLAAMDDALRVDMQIVDTPAVPT